MKTRHPIKAILVVSFGQSNISEVMAAKCRKTWKFVDGYLRFLINDPLR